MSNLEKINNIILTSAHDNLDFGLDACWLANQQKKPLVVFIHGFNGFKDWGAWHLFADFFAQAGFVFVKFNLSHNGTSVDAPTEFVNIEAYGNDLFSTDLDDIGLVIDYLYGDQCPFSAEIDFEKLYLIGHSRAGALAILKAGEDARVKKIATWASIISTAHFWTPENIAEVTQKGAVYYYNGRTKQNLPLYKAYYEDILLNPDRLNVEAKFKNLAIPILVAHGTADTSIPHQFAHKLKKWQPEVELFLLDEANHTFGVAHPWEDPALPQAAQILAEKTRDFFAQ
ncbi:MAG: dienelactone hydrolase family protein [Microscillaceae bacterium]|jgi:pimeloyl-ACP methyl ester carboxylesterase|nr:dienelactone hydrolase family protein [Microscillaceae bacterium]